MVCIGCAVFVVAGCALVWLVVVCGVLSVVRDRLWWFGGVWACGGCVLSSVLQQCAVLGFVVNKHLCLF